MKNTESGGHLRFLTFAILGLLLLLPLNTFTLRNTSNDLGIIPLPQALINSACPNLPTAKDLLGSSMNKPLIVGNSSMVNGEFENFTMTTVGSMNGEIYVNLPYIYEYNGSLWVLVPQQVVESDVACAQALSSYNPAGSPTIKIASASTAPTWALGMYSDPASISGGSNVTGVRSYIVSTWPWTPNTSNCPSSLCFTWYDIVTGADNQDYYQIGLLNQVPGNAHSDAAGYDANLQIWRSGLLYMSADFSITYSNGSAYPMQLQWDSTYVRAYWNGGQLGAQPLSSGENGYMLTGNQPSVVVESDDTTLSDFSNFRAQIGSWSTGTCPCLQEPAESYLINNAWNPDYGTGSSGVGSIAHAYVYYGGYNTGMAFGVANNNQASWFGVGGGTEFAQFCVYLHTYSSFCGTPAPALGTQLW